MMTSKSLINIRLITITVLLLSSYVIWAQQINGVGKLQLGMTIHSARELLGDSLIADTKYSSTNDSCFKVGKYEPVKDYYLKKITLYFHNGKLYGIFADEQYRMNEAFTIKYGEPIVRKEYPKDRVSEYAKIYRFRGEDTFYEWNTGNPDVLARYIEMYYYNRENELCLDKVFMIRDLKVEKEVQEIQEEERKRIENDERNKKLKELEGI